MGKRFYPTHPLVLDTILMIRQPAGTGAGQRDDMFLQHTDISAQVLDFAGISPPQPLHGLPFWEAALRGGETHRDHVTVGWGAAMTVIDDHWWLNCKVDGRDSILYDLTTENAFTANLADSIPEIVQHLFMQGVADAGGEFPDYLLKQARGEVEIRQWNPLAPEGELRGFI